MVLMHRMNRAVPAVRGLLLAAAPVLGGCAAAPRPAEVLTAPLGASDSLTYSSAASSSSDRGKARALSRRENWGI